jgi:polar amino acid transport system substrate-binding protein
MKKTGLVLGAFFTLAAVLLPVAVGCAKKDNAAAGQAQMEVHAATAGMPRPFSYVDETGKLVGHNIELVEAIFERLPQYKLVFEVTDFPSIFAGLDADRYQLGVNNFSINEERKQKYIFTKPIFENRYIAAVAENNNSLGGTVRTLADLAGKTTLNTVGTNMATAITNHNNANPGALIKQDFSDINLLVALQMVESGQYDFNLIDKPLFDFYINEFGLKLRGIELSPEVSDGMMQSPFSYILASKGNDKLVDDINKALAEVIADGTSKRICEKYFGSDYSPKL